MPNLGLGFGAVRGLSAVHLGPSGHTGPDKMPIDIYRQMSDTFLAERRPFQTRAYDAYVHIQHVQELGQFVDAAPTEKQADRRAKRIALHCRGTVGLGRCLHGRQLEHFPISLHHTPRQRSSLRIHGVSRSG